MCTAICTVRHKSYWPSQNSLLFYESFSPREWELLFLYASVSRAELWSLNRRTTVGFYETGTVSWNCAHYKEKLFLWYAGTKNDCVFERRWLSFKCCIHRSVQRELGECPKLGTRIEVCYISDQSRDLNTEANVHYLGRRLFQWKGIGVGIAWRMR
jgi:hypothetical protein